jgi:2-C-methyl-D-erythritol 4-phosphate cytidylyltransferase
VTGAHLSDPVGGAPARPKGRTAVVLPAAGRGDRLGSGTPKALRTVGGVTILERAVSTVRQAAGVDVVVVAAPADRVDEVASRFAGEAQPTETAVHVVSGGASRSESVRLALAALPDDVDVVLVHDAARALTPVWLIEAVDTAVRAGADAVVPALHVTDTIKSVDASERVTSTLDRSALRAVQTPQGFRRTVLAAAHDAARARAADGLGGNEVTDDAGLVESMGVPVLVVAGSELAFKITRPLDLVVAEALLAAAPGTEDLA